MGEKKMFENLDLGLERDVFLRTLVRELSGVLQEVVGLDEAAGFISTVGQRIGTAMNNDYKNKLEVNNLNKDQVTRALVDLKERIKGDFYVIEETEDKVIFGNNKCPFEDKVVGRPSLCMMTSNVFGTIASQNMGYAKVSLDETIAQGDKGCRVTVYFNENNDSDGREYFKEE